MNSKPTDMDLITDHPYQPSEWGDICGHIVRGWPCGFGVVEHANDPEDRPMTVERMDLSGLERPALEMYARNLDAALDICEAERARLQTENERLRGDVVAAETECARLIVKVDALGSVIGDIEAALDQGVKAAALARMVLLDTSTPEDDE